MTLHQWALVAFAGVASGGLLMAALIAARKRIPGLIPTAHGLGGLAALALLFAANLRRGDALPAVAWWSLGVLASGFVGGLLLFRVIFKDRATLPLVAVHASVAAAGIFLLYRAAF
ncbi:MAG: hypothetical protein NVS9B10_08390 [Nevskia sp.]